MIGVYVMSFQTTYLNLNKIEIEACVIYSKRYRNIYTDAANQNSEVSIEIL